MHPANTQEGCLGKKEQEKQHCWQLKIPFLEIKIALKNQARKG